MLFIFLVLEVLVSIIDFIFYGVSPAKTDLHNDYMI